MNVFSYIKDVITNCIKEYKVNESALKNLTVEYPKQNSWGEISTNAGIIIGKSTSNNPVEIAKKIATKLLEHDFIEKAEVAPPGFINITFKITFWQNFLSKALSMGEDYSSVNIGNGEKINLEFVSANPTGPMHLGHARGAIYGDALSRLLSKSGFNVTKEYYINDSGKQIDILAKSLLIRYRQQFGENIEIPDDCYPGDYLIQIAQELKAEQGDKILSYPECSKVDFIKKYAVERIMQMIKDDLNNINVQHDIFSSEKKLVQDGKVENCIQFLKQKGTTYQGILDAPKGKVLEDWEPKKQLLFKSSLFGDDVDRPIQRSDGTYTYFATDIAYHKDKIDRGFNNMILLLGADHGGYVKRMKAVVNALSDDVAKIDIKICQLVTILKAGKAVKMSKRSGNFTTLKEITDEIGADALRFGFLTKKPDTLLELDIEKMKEQSKDNPIFYIQYASARSHSILNKAKDLKIDITDLNNADFSLLETEYDLKIIKNIALLPKIIESSVKLHEPHRITYYLYNLAESFHSSWTQGKNQENLKFILPDNIELTKARAGLAECVKNVIFICLNYLGINPVKSM